MHHEDRRIHNRAFARWGSRRRGGSDAGYFESAEALESVRPPRDRHRRRRPLDQGDLRYVLLHLLAERPRHGYDLIKGVEDLTGGAYAPSPGVVYPTLTLFEELGFARVVEPGQPRKLYELTPEGLTELDAHAQDVQRLLAQLGRLNQSDEALDADVLRASQNVSRALFLRPGRKRWTAEQAEQVARILDRAAAEIEQII